MSWGKFNEEYAKSVFCLAPGNRCCWSRHRFVGGLAGYPGNPANMGVCVACFERDIAGALGLHRASAVQYLRPEIPAFVLGSLVAALLFGEFRVRAGSAPVVRFLLGVFAAIGALVFLGCPWRSILRLAGGDFNAVTGISGLAFGIGIGAIFLKNGFTLGRAREALKPAGWIMPCLMIGLLVLAFARPAFILNQCKRAGFNACSYPRIPRSRTVDRFSSAAQPFLHNGFNP